MRDSKKINLTKGQKGQELVKSYDQLHHEGTQYIEKEDSIVYL